MLIYFSNIFIDDMSAQSRQVLAMSKAFHKLLNHNFKLVTLYKNIESSENISVEKFSLTKSIRNVKRNIRPFILFFLFFETFKFAKKNNGTVFCRELMPALISILFGINTIYEIHQLPSKLNRFTLVLLSKSKKFHLLSISAALNTYVKENICCDNDFYYHDGIDVHNLRTSVNSYKPCKSLINILEKDKVAVYTGSLTKGNDFDLVLDLARERLDYTFIIAGGSKENIHKYKIKSTPNLIYLGYIEQEACWYIQGRADVLIFPLTTTNKLWEVTSPLKLFEYMASNTPIVASNIGSVSEIINENICFPFDPNNKVSMLEAFDSATNNNTNKINVTNNAFNLVLNKYTWDKRVQYIYSKILKKKNEKNANI